MEKEKCIFCNEDLGTGPHYHDHGKGMVHLKCHSLVTNIRDMNEENLMRIMDLINERLSKLNK